MKILDGSVQRFSARQRMTVDASGCQCVLVGVFPCHPEIQIHPCYPELKIRITSVNCKMLYGVCQDGLLERTSHRVHPVLYVDVLSHEPFPHSSKNAHATARPRLIRIVSNPRETVRWNVHLSKDKNPRSRVQVSPHPDLLQSLIGVCAT